MLGTGSEPGLSQATGWREAGVRRAGEGGGRGRGIHRGSHRVSTLMRSDPGSGDWGHDKRDSQGDRTPPFLQRPMPWDKEPGSGELEKGWTLHGRRRNEKPGVGCVSITSKVP